MLGFQLLQIAMPLNVKTAAIPCLSDFLDHGFGDITSSYAYR